MLCVAMCLLVLGLGADRRWPLLLVANRDEYYCRPTQTLQRWPSAPSLYAGRDLVEGGTWLGLTEGGRFAALTNFRDGPPTRGVRSRGHVVLEFLRSADSPADYLRALGPKAEEYGGFSVVVGELAGEARYLSNRVASERALTPGLYGLSNAELDSPWPKVRLAKDRVRALLDAGAVTPRGLCDALCDSSRPGDAELPDTGIGLPLERELSPMFIAGATYGTRAVSAFVVDGGGRAALLERSFGPHGEHQGDVACEFRIPG